MKKIFANLEAALEESNRLLFEEEKVLQEKLNSALETNNGIKIIDSDEKLKVTRMFMGESVVEYQQELLQDRSIEYRGSIFLGSSIGVGSIDYDNKHYVGLINLKTLEPYLAGVVYTMDEVETLYLSSGIDYGILTLKPAKKSPQEVLDFLKKAVENGHLEEKVLDFLENPKRLLEKTTDYVKKASFKFNNVAIFNNNEHVIMFEEMTYNYETEKREPEQRFSIINADDTETIFKNLKATELNLLVTIINQHYVQSGEILYPLSMVIRNSKKITYYEDAKEIYFVSVPSIQELVNAKYYQYTDDFGLKEADLEISGYVSGKKYTERFKDIEGLMETAWKVTKWNEPYLYICFNQKEIACKLLGIQPGISIKTEVQEMSYFFER